VRIEFVVRILLYKGSEAPEPNDDGRPKRTDSSTSGLWKQKEAINLFDSDDNVSQ